LAAAASQTVGEDENDDRANRKQRPEATTAERRLA
jgi:hypothetical protein